MDTYIPFDHRGYFDYRALENQRGSGATDVKYHRGSYKTDATTRKFCKEHGLPDIVAIRDEVYGEEVSK